MLTVFLNNNGDVLFTYPNITLDLFTYPNITLDKGDFVKRNGKTYMVIKKVFVADGGFYEMTLSESQKS